MLLHLILQLLTHESALYFKRQGHRGSYMVSVTPTCVAQSCPPERRANLDHPTDRPNPVVLSRRKFCPGRHLALSADSLDFYNLEREGGMVQLALVG